MNRNFLAGHILRSSVVLLLLGLSAGCHSTRTVYRERGFDTAALNAGGLALVAVTRPEEADYYAAPYIAEQVVAQFHLAWPDLKVLPMNVTQALLGDTNHFMLQEAFRERAILPPDKFALLEPLSHHVRYALLIDVREDHADNGYSVSKSENEQWVQDPKTGKYYVEYDAPEYTASWSSSRFIRTLFIIYDLETHQHVWIATGTDSRVYTNSKTDTYRVPYVTESAGASPQELMAVISKRLLRKVPSAMAEKSAAAGE